MTETPVAAPEVMYPAWDPPPRKPSRLLSWLALVTFLASAGFAYWQFQGFFGARYEARPDFCPAVDAGPFSAALGVPVGPAKRADDGVVPVGEQQRCLITADGPDGSPRALGVVALTHYRHEVVADVYYAMGRDQVAKTIGDRVNRLDLTGTAFGYHDPASKPPRFQVTAVDSNLLITVEVAVAAEDPDWRSGTPAPAYATLQEVIRATLKRLG